MRKKVKIGFIIGLVLALLCGCTASGRLAKKQPLQVKKMFENKQSFVVCALRADCDVCNDYKVTLKQLSKDYNLPIYYILLTEEIMADDDMNDLIYNYLTYLEIVPTTYIVINGKVVMYAEEEVGYDGLVEWLSEYGFISK